MLGGHLLFGSGAAVGSLIPSGAVADSDKEEKSQGDRKDGTARHLHLEEPTPFPVSRAHCSRTKKATLSVENGCKKTREKEISWLSFYGVCSSTPRASKELIYGLLLLRDEGSRAESERRNRKREEVGRGGVSENI